MAKIINVVAGEVASSITQTELGDVIARYRRERLESPPKDLTKDSTSVWISREKIMEFFTENKTSGGIRFYFGVVDDPNLTGAYKGVHNLVLISTDNQRVDQVSDTDAVIVARNAKFEEGGEAAVATPVMALICPPPTDRCTGRRFN